MLEERGMIVDCTTIYRWVHKFGPKIAKPLCAHRSCRGLNWHVDKTYIRVRGKWSYLWRAVDQNGKFIDFHLTAKRDAKAARDLLKRTFESFRLYRPIGNCTDRAGTYHKELRRLNFRCDQHFDSIKHSSKKYRNNRIESTHAALKQIIEPSKGFQILHSSKASLRRVEAIRTIKHGHIYGHVPGTKSEITFLHSCLT